MFRSPDQGAEFILEPVLLMRLPDEVEHGQALFALRHPQSTSQLLQEYGQTLGRT
ncbi:hypothetical protein D3C76_1614660 [compost metagenome]